MPKDISRAHFIYIIIIFILIIAFISGISFSDNDELVNIISVTSGMISITIGTLAIFVAIYQGLTQGTSIEKMNESADRVEATTKILNETNFGMMEKNINYLKNSVSELTNENLDVTKRRDSLKLSKESYKTIFLQETDEFFFSAIIQKSYLTKVPFIIIRTGTLISNYQKTKNTQDVITAHNFLFARYLNMLRRTGAVTYTIDPEEKKAEVTIDDISDEFLGAIKESRLKYTKVEEILNYVEENDNLFSN